MRRKLRFLTIFVVAVVMSIPVVAGAVGGFNGPLFGLSHAKNGDLWVADASTGIISVSGGSIGATISLPGATDVSQASKNVLWATTGAGGSPEMDTGQALYRIKNGTPTLVANLFEFEEEVNPDVVLPHDSNPYDVHALSKKQALVVDAGGNDLIKVRKNGKIRVLAVFPDKLVSTANIKSLAGCPGSGADFCFLPDMMPAQSVPTSVTVGSDGYYYVGELTGFPGPTGESSIWRVHPKASWAQCGSSPDCVKVFDGGFTSIIDLAYHDGYLYVAELDESSWVAVEIFQSGVGGTVSACDLGTLSCDVVASGIPLLTAISLDRHGNLWATQNSLIPGLAEVVQID